MAEIELTRAAYEVLKEDAQRELANACQERLMFRGEDVRASVRSASCSRAPMFSVP